MDITFAAFFAALRISFSLNSAGSSLVQSSELLLLPDASSSSAAPSESAAPNAATAAFDPASLSGESGAALAAPLVVRATAAGSPAVSSMPSSLQQSSALGASDNDLLAARRFALQLLEHVVTSSQHRSHFFLHVNGRLHTTQTWGLTRGWVRTRDDIGDIIGMYAVAASCMDQWTFNNCRRAGSQPLWAGSLSLLLSAFSRLLLCRSISLPEQRLCAGVHENNPPAVMNARKET